MDQSLGVKIILIEMIFSELLIIFKLKQNIKSTKWLNSRLASDLYQPFETNFIISHRTKIY